MHSKSVGQLLTFLKVFMLTCEICEAEARMKALVMERTAKHGEMTSLIADLQQQVTHALLLSHKMFAAKSGVILVGYKCRNGKSCKFSTKKTLRVHKNCFFFKCF